jgi:hypothetical protein
MTAAPHFSPLLLALCSLLEYHTGSITAEGQADWNSCSTHPSCSRPSALFLSIRQGAAQQRGMQIGITAAPPISPAPGLLLLTRMSHREEHSRGAGRLELQQLLPSLLLLAFCSLLECHTGSSTAEGQADRNVSSSSLFTPVLALCSLLEYHTGSSTAEEQAD